MRAIAVLLISFLVNSCTITVKPIETVPGHRRHQSTKSAKKSVKKPTEKIGVISVDHSGALVTSAWMQRYQKLASKYGQADEGQIEVVDGDKFKVNRAIIDHFTDMKRADDQ
jgi:hypothetical protein